MFLFVHTGFSYSEFGGGGCSMERFVVCCLGCELAFGLKLLWAVVS